MISIIILYQFRVLIICFRLSGYVYLSFGISLSNLVFSVLTLSELFCDGLPYTFVNWSVILLPIKSPVASPVFWIAIFEAVLTASVADC